MPKVAEKVQKQTGNVTENGGKVAENHNKVAEKVNVNDKRVNVNVTEKVNVNVTEKVNATENVIDASQKTSQKIIDLIKEDPYISTTKMAEIIGIDRRNIARNIKKLQEQGAVHRVGPDKGVFFIQIANLL